MAETLTSLIDYTRKRADMEGTAFVTDDEITHYLNDEIKAMYSKMVNIEEGILFATVAPTLTKVGDNAYALPSDFMRLVDVNVYTGSQWVPASPADPQEYYQLLDDTYTGDYDTRFFLHRNNTLDRYELFVFPVGSASNLGVRYIPNMPTLSLGNETLNWPSNWHQVPVLGAAIKCVIKEESDPSALMIEQESEIRRVLKDVRAQKIATVKTLRHIGPTNRRRFRLNRNF